MKVNISSNSPPFHYEFKTNDSGIVAVYGASGSGKSTLINALSGQNPNLNGQIIFHDSDLREASGMHKICYMSQDPILFPHWNVLENLNFAIKYSDNNYELIDYLIKRLECNKLLKKMPSQLSGGEKQRIALIRTLVLANKNSLILLDEPFSALDSDIRLVAIESINQFKKDTLIFLVSHNIKELYRISNEFIYLQDNKIIHSSETTNLMATGLNKLPIASRIKLNSKHHIVYADNVSVSLINNESSSIIHQLPSKIIKIKDFSEYVLLSLLIEDKQLIYSKITHQSFKRLMLRLNLSVYANFKATND